MQKKFERGMPPLDPSLQPSTFDKKMKYQFYHHELIEVLQNNSIKRHNKDLAVNSDTYNHHNYHSYQLKKPLMKFIS